MPLINLFWHLSLYFKHVKLRLSLQMVYIMHKMQKTKEKAASLLNLSLEEEMHEMQLDISPSANIAAIDDTSSHKHFTGNVFLKLIKTLFLFLPGAFLLYFTSIFFLFAFFVDKMSMLSFNPGLWLLGVLMTVVGSNGLKSWKGFLIPAAIYSMSFFVFLLSFAFSGIDQVKFLFEYSIYFFPIILIAAYLVQNTFVDESE